MFGKCYVLSDAAPCWVSEANLGELLGTLSQTKTPPFSCQFWIQQTSS